MSTQPEERMVEIEFGGIGNLSNDPGAIVMLLMPTGGTLTPYPDKHMPVFPVPIDVFTGRLYLRRLYRALKGGDATSEVLQGYCRVLNLTPERVNIRLDESAVRTTLDVSYGDGTTESVPVRLHSTVLAAVLNDIPLYVESTLLERMSQNVRIQGRENWHDDPKALVHAQTQALKELISSGANPEEMTNEQEQFLLSLDTDVLSALLDIAVQTENFEWAARLQNIRNSDGQQPE